MQACLRLPRRPRVPNFCYLCPFSKIKFMRRSIIFTLLFMLLLSGCQVRKIGIRNVSLGSVHLESTSAADVELIVDMDNPGKSAISLIHAEASLYRDGKEFARAVLMETAIASPGFSGELPVKLQVSFVDPMALLTIGLNFGSWSLDSFSVDGKAVIKGNGGKRTLRMNNIPLQKLVGQYVR